MSMEPVNHARWLDSWGKGSYYPPFFVSVVNHLKSKGGWPARHTYTHTVPGRRWTHFWIREAKKRLDQEKGGTTSPLPHASNQLAWFTGSTENSHLLKRSIVWRRARKVSFLVYSLI